MLADELDNYKGQGNQYVDNNIQKIQELYKNRKQKKEDRKVKDKEVILIEPYEVSVKNKRSRLNIFLFSYFIFILFSIYFLILFLELGLGLE